MEETMDIFGKIKDAFDGLSKSNKKIALYILKHRADVLVLTARELSDRIGVSEPTIIRFARTMGFRSYRDLLRCIKKDTMQSSGAMTILDEILLKHDKPPESYMETVNQDIDNIRRTFLHLDGKVLDELSDRIIAARNIGIIGVRGEMTPAVFLSHFLNELFNNTRLLYPHYGDSYDQIRTWDERDLIIAFAFWDNNSYLRSIMSYAKSKNCYCVLVTREQSESMKRIADTYIPVETEGAFISYAASVTLVNVILDMITKKLPEEVLFESITETDLILSYSNKYADHPELDASKNQKD